MNHFSVACKEFFLVISIKKTVILTQEGTSKGTITLDDKPLEPVRKFCYLGSTITSRTSLDEEIGIRIGKAVTSFGTLSKRAWTNKIIAIKTKIKIYVACTLRTPLLYGSETWTLYSGEKTECVPPALSKIAGREQTHFLKQEPKNASA